MVRRSQMLGYDLIVGIVGLAKSRSEVRYMGRLRETLLAETPESKPLGDYDPTTIDRSSILALQRFIDNPTIGTLLNNMNWSVCDVSLTKYRFVTSDRPIVMTNGLGTRNGHLALPISPTIAFLATVKQVVRNATKFVWASDESQSALIKKQMSVDARHDRTFFGESRVSDDIVIAARQKTEVGQCCFIVCVSPSVRRRFKFGRADPPIHLGRRLGFTGLRKSGLPVGTGRQHLSLFPHRLGEVL
jgi:hypothetical protein